MTQTMNSRPLPLCLVGDTTMMSIRPSTLASTVSLLRPVCLSTRWMDLVCQSVQYIQRSCCEMREKGVSGEETGFNWGEGRGKKEEGTKKEGTEERRGREGE